MKEAKAENPSAEGRASENTRQKDKEIVGRVFRIVSNLKRARENINAAESELQRAENDYKVSQRRFTNGNGSPGEVKTSLQQLTKANMANNQAKYDFQIAMIGLEEILSLDLGNLGDSDLADLNPMKR